MADSAGIIPSKNSEKSKLSNSINRTTSETLRLTETDRVLTHPNSLSSSTPRKKTSFIITSVTSRTSNDAGEDSADDLDESHTEDISEIVDNSRERISRTKRRAILKTHSQKMTCSLTLPPPLFRPQ